MHRLTLIQEVMVWILPVLFAVTVHEVSHGWVASRFGDKTAQMLGRLTLNPFKHIDLMGTIVVPLVCLLLGDFIFGWAKPVPVDWRNLKKPRRDTALVALAGPFSNFVMALLWAALAKVGQILLSEGLGNVLFLVYMGYAGISINLLLMILNLIPIPPLDGSRVVATLLPRSLATPYEAIEPYGFMILVILILSKGLSFILLPPLNGVQTFIMKIFAL